MKVIKDTELILTPEKKVYHLNLSEEEIAKDIIIVGDKARVGQISQHFDTIEHKVENSKINAYDRYSSVVYNLVSSLIVLIW